MNKINEVKKYINDNPDLSLSKLFSHYRIDLESVLISAILLGLDYDDILKEVNSKTLNEEDEINRIEDYMHDDLLFSKVIPPSVHTAFILLFYQHKEKSKEIVNVAKKLDSYLIDIKKENLFDRPIVFFSTQIDLRSSNVIENIREKIKALQMVFIEPAFKDFFEHFELNDFLSYDTESELEFLKIIDKNHDDAIFPGLVHQKALLEDTSVKILFDNTYLENSIRGLNKEIDYKHVFTEFIKLFYDEMKNEAIESSMKYMIAAKPLEFGMLDLSVKAVKSFVVALSQSNTPLSKTAVSEDHANFISSGKYNVKDWFLDQKTAEFQKALESAGIEIIEVNQKLFENYYQQFIERYYVMYGVYSPDSQMPSDHTVIFKSVYDTMFNYSVINRQLL